MPDPQMMASFGRWGSAGGNVALEPLKIALGHSHLLASFPGRHRMKILLCHRLLPPEMMPLERELKYRK